MKKNGKKVVVLCNVYDDHYLKTRSDSVARCLSSPKRSGLFRCIELATGREVIILSSHPRPAGPRKSLWLPEVKAFFSTHRQLFCGHWDIPKFNIPLSWCLYARHVLRHTKDGDIILIDNYEIIYVISAIITRLFRHVSIVLDYEDGKHLIDKGWQRVLSGLGEFLGRPLLKGALLAHPSLASRLPKELPKELVPGFVLPIDKRDFYKQPQPVRFLYSGSLDRVRGVDLILQSLELLPQHGWHLDVTGLGAYAGDFKKLAFTEKYRNRLTYHGSLDQVDYDELVSQVHVGLNCQRKGDPISNVTFPSKIFSYLSSGLSVLSSLASDVPQICGSALIYFNEETPESLAAAMKAIIDHPEESLTKVNMKEVVQFFSLEETTIRFSNFFKKIVINK